MSTAYIGIGSNLGSREENCKRALALLSKNGVRVSRHSSMIETKPWGFREQPNFINMAVEIETDLGPHELLKLLKKIEDGMGRKPSVRMGPRVIDLDILIYDDLLVKTPELEIPHPWIKDRDFVLRPLAEIAPDRIHPVYKKRIRYLLDNLNVSPTLNP